MLIAKEEYEDATFDIKIDFLTRFLADSERTPQRYTKGHGNNPKYFGYESSPGVWTVEDYKNNKDQYGEAALKYSGTNINTGSQLGPLSPWIRTYSDRINGWLESHKWENGARYGWITMDFPSDTLIKKIIATNEIITTPVRVDIQWEGPTHFVDELGEKPYVIGTHEYSVSNSIVKMEQAEAEKLESGKINIGINPKCPLLHTEYPYTFNFEHVGKNHWICYVYPSIRVAVNWDYTDPAPVEDLFSNFFTAKYDRSGKVLSGISSHLRLQSYEKSKTVLYLCGVVPFDPEDGNLILDLDPNGPGANYRYNKDKDREQVSNTSWYFTLHAPGETIDMEGSAAFDDNNNVARLRPDRLQGILYATGSPHGTPPSHNDPVLFTIMVEPKAPDYSWKQTDLPLQANGYDLTWDLDLYNIGGYSRTYSRNGNRIDTLYTLNPAANIDIRWQGENGDTSHRPDALQIHVIRKSDGTRIDSKTVRASDNWHTSIFNLQGDDWTLELKELNAYYSYEGPFTTEDNMGMYFVCNYQEKAQFYVNARWWDGLSDPEPMHPAYTLSVYNGIESITKLSGGKSTSLQNTFLCGPYEVTDSTGKPYVYTVRPESIPDDYICQINGYDVTLIRKTSLESQYRWFDASGTEIARPFWITEDPVPFLWRSPVNDFESAEVIDAQPVMAGNAYTYTDLPLAIVGAKPGKDRYQYWTSVNTATLPGVASYSVEDYWTEHDRKGKLVAKYTSNINIKLAPLPVNLPVTIHVANTAYHPEQEFVIDIADATGKTVATRSVIMGKSIETGSYDLNFSINTITPGEYTITMRPVVPSSKYGTWTIDPSPKKVAFKVVLNPETNNVEAVLSVDEPVFNVNYVVEYAPVSIDVSYTVNVINNSSLSKAPDVDFKINAQLNGEAFGSKSVKAGKPYNIQMSVSEPGEYIFTAEQVPFNSMLWSFDESAYAITVNVWPDNDGVLHVEYPDDPEHAFTNIYIGETTRISGIVSWDESILSDDQGKAFRPKQVVLELTPYYTDELLKEQGLSAADVPVLDTLIVPVTDGDYQTFDFGWRERFDEDGVLCFYSVREQPIPNYTVTDNVDGTYSVLNKLTADVTHVEGSVLWNDAVDSAYRPASVNLRLLRRDQNGGVTEIKQLIVKPDDAELWNFDFGFYPLKDGNGNTFSYTITEDPISGYTAKIDGYTVENTKLMYHITSGDGRSYLINGDDAISFTCDGPLEKFVGIVVDGVKVDPRLYTVVSGSTVLTFTPNARARFPGGRHTIRFYYTDGTSNEGTFNMTTVPPTGDTSRPGISILLLLFSTAALIITARARKRL